MREIKGPSVQLDPLLFDDVYVCSRLDSMGSAFDFARAVRATCGSRFNLFKAVWANLGGRVCGFFFALHELVDSLYQ